LKRNGPTPFLFILFRAKTPALSLNLVMLSTLGSF